MSEKQQKWGLCHIEITFPLEKFDDVNALVSEFSEEVFERGRGRVIPTVSYLTKGIHP